MGRINMGRQMYAEAFPSIDIVQAEAHLKRREQLCQWITEHKAPVGYIQIRELNVEHIVVDYVFYGTPNVEAADDAITVKLIRRDRGKYRARPDMICPDCEKPCQKLFYVERHWSCRICHHLTSVGRFVNKPVKKMRRKLYLKAATSFGRQPGQHAKTFQKMLDEIEALDVIRIPYWWEHELYFMQVANWPASGFRLVPDKPHRWGYRWTAGAEGGFQRLLWKKSREGKPLTPAGHERMAAVRARAERLEAKRAERLAKPKSPKSRAIQPHVGDRAQGGYDFSLDEKTSWYSDR